MEGAPPGQAHLLLFSPCSERLVGSISSALFPLVSESVAGNEGQWEKQATVSLPGSGPLRPGQQL